MLPDFVVSTMMPPAEPPIFSGVVVRQDSNLIDGLDGRIEVNLSRTDTKVLSCASVNPEHLALGSSARETEIRIRITWRLL